MNHGGSILCDTSLAGIYMNTYIHLRHSAALTDICDLLV